MVPSTSAPLFELFVAHAAADLAFVEGYLLPALGLPAGVVRYSAQLPAGPEAIDLLVRDLERTRVALVVLSPAFVTDPWAQHTEDWATHVALDGERTLIPLLLSPCDVPLHLTAQVGIDFCRVEEWEQNIARLRRHFDSPLPLEPVLDCPYPGMRPFAAADAAHFHGRDRELAELITHLDAGARELHVLGPSGSGKSSLIYAGLLPEMARRAGAVRPLVRTFRPGDAPLARLAAALGITADDSRAVPDQAALRGAVDALLAVEPKASSLLLFVDQLEELFALADVVQQAHFADAVAALRAEPRVVLLFTLRADFLAELMQSPLWAERGAPHVDVAPMRGEALRSAIEEPARTTGVLIEPALVERLIADADAAACPLPLVQETLVHLWERRRRRFLPLAVYDSLGDAKRSGLAIAISRRADLCLAQLSQESQLLARRTFLRLVSFGEGRPDTRRQQAVSALRGAEPTAELQRVLAALAAARLIVMDAGAKSSDDRVDLAHEALITAWPPLAEWVKVRRIDEERRRQLQVRAALWVSRGRTTSGLLDAEELPGTLAWARSDAAAELGQSAEASAFLAASTEHIGRARRRRTRTIVLVASSLLALSVVSFSLAVFASAKARDALAQRNTAEEQRKIALAERATAEERRGEAVRQRSEAEQQRAEAEAQRAEAESQRTRAEDQRARAEKARADNGRLLGLSYQETGRKLLLEGKGQRALPFFVAARAQGLESESLRMLFHLASANPLLATLRHDDAITAFAVSRDGRFLFSASDDRTIKIWQLPSGQLRHTLTHDAGVADFALSEDESRLIAVNRKGAVWTWDVATGLRRGEPVQLGDENVYEPRLSAGGHRVAMAMPSSQVESSFSKQGAYLWDLDDPTAAPHQLHLDETVQELSFSPDGKRLFTLSSTGVLKVWDADSGELLMEKKAVSARFTPDSKRIVISERSGESRVWELASGELAFASVSFLQPSLWGIVTEPGGSLLASFGGNETRIWNERGGAVGPPLLHSGPVHYAGFRSGGGQLITGSEDHTARIWHVGSGLPMTGELDHGANVYLVGFAGEAQLAFSIGDDHNIRLWDAQPLGREITASSDLVISADRHRFATSASNGVELWDARTGARLARLPSLSSSRSNRVALSADGRRLLTEENEGMLLVRKADSGAAPGSPFDALAGSPASPSEQRRNDRQLLAIALSDDGTRAAAAFHATYARVWDSAIGKPLTPPLHHKDARWLTHIAFAPDGAALLTLGNQGPVRLWSVAAGEEKVPALVHPARVTSAIFLDSARILTVCADGKVRIWSAVTGKLERTFAHGDVVHAARVSDDGTLLATAGDDNTARIWNLASGEQVMPPLAHPDDVRSLAFSADGCCLLTIAGGGLRLWEIVSGALLFELPSAGLALASFSSDGGILARDLNDRIWRWSVEPDMRSLRRWRAVERRGRFRLDRGRLIERQE